MEIVGYNTRSLALLPQSLTQQRDATTHYLLRASAAVLRLSRVLIITIFRLSCVLMAR